MSSYMVTVLFLVSSVFQLVKVSPCSSSPPYFEFNRVRPVGVSSYGFKTVAVLKLECHCFSGLGSCES